MIGGYSKAARQFACNQPWSGIPQVMQPLSPRKSTSFQQSGQNSGHLRR
jgi:hypothetical protein